MMGETARSSHDKAATRAHLEAYLESYPGLRGRVCRILLLHLHTMGLARIEEIYRRAEHAEEWHVPSDPNVPEAQLWAADEKEVINQIVINLAAEHLSPGRGRQHRLGGPPARRGQVRRIPRPHAGRPARPDRAQGEPVREHRQHARQRRHAALPGGNHGRPPETLRHRERRLHLGREALPRHPRHQLGARAYGLDRARQRLGRREGRRDAAGVGDPALEGLPGGRPAQHRVRADGRLHGLQGAQRAHRAGGPQVPAGSGRCGTTTGPSRPSSATRSSRRASRTASGPSSPAGARCR